MADSKLRKKDEKNFNIDVDQWENKDLGIKLWFIKIEKKFWFFGKELGLALEYTDPKEAIHDHVDPEDKKTIEELLGKDYKTILMRSFSSERKTTSDKFFRKLHPNQKLVSELGLISFCTKSRKPRAVPFQRWMYKTIQEIRETGVYTLPGGPIENPLDLVTKANTFEKRVKSSQKKTKMYDKETQTPSQNTENVKDSLRKLKSKLEKSIKKVEFELKKSFEEINPSYYSSSSSRSSSDSE